MLKSPEDSPLSLFLLAEVAGEIVGLLNYAGGKRRAMRHVATQGEELAQMVGHLGEGFGQCAQLGREY